MIVNTSTDDFLCTYSCLDIYQSICSHLKKYFDITTKQGDDFMYLNIHIIQTQYGISYYQTYHIINSIVSKLFPPETTECLKTVDTPYRTDSGF